MKDAGVEQLALRLLATDSPELRRGVELLVDALLAQPLSELVDLTQVADWVLAALAGSASERLIDDHITPGWFRQLERADAESERLEDWLPAEVWAEIPPRLERLHFPRGKWARELLDTQSLRELLAPVVQATLTSFVKRLPGVGTASDRAASLASGVAEAAGKSSALSGLASRLKQQVGESAKGIAEVGRSMAQGIEGKAQRAASEFSRTAQDEFRAAFIERVRSRAGQVLVKRMRDHAVERARGIELADMLRDLEGVRGMLADLAPASLRHNAGRAAVHHAVHLEVEAFLAERGDEPVSAWLDEFGLLAEVREGCIQKGQSIARRLLARPELLEFLSHLRSLG